MVYFAWDNNAQLLTCQFFSRELSFVFFSF